MTGRAGRGLADAVDDVTRRVGGAVRLAGRVEEVPGGAAVRVAAGVVLTCFWSVELLQLMRGNIAAARRTTGRADLTRACCPGAAATRPRPSRSPRGRSATRAASRG